MFIGLPEWRTDDLAADHLFLNFSGESVDLKVLVAKAWPIMELADHYRDFIRSFAPLNSVLETASGISEADAIVARVLMIHEFRRIVLRDPLLPDEVLPPDWPGRAARELGAQLYARLEDASERWLDKAVNEHGRLPPSSAAKASRFS
jgi:phenylacetic acid degradation operon negative regulatory protein